jgi:hypothetical protein
MKKNNILLGIILMSSFVYGQDTWLKKANYTTGRVWPASFRIGNKGYFGTGNNGTTQTKDFWEYNTINNTWTQKANFGGLAREGALGLSIGNKGYIGLGVTVGTRLNDFWEYDTATNTWANKRAFPGTKRGYAVGFSIGTKGYIGTGETSNLVFVKDFWEYDTTTGNWTQKADFGGVVRGYAVGFSIENKGYIATGYTTSSLKLADFWEYDTSTNSWTQKANFPGSPRYRSYGVGIGKSAFIGMGFSDVANETQDFYQYDQNTDTWVKRSDYPIPIRAIGGFAIGNKVYFGGGSGLLGVTKPDFYQYTPYLQPTNILISDSVIKENSITGTAVGILSTLDPNSTESFTYTLVNGAGSTDNALFYIETGVLKSGARFDYETKNMYSVRVRTTDPKGYYYEKSINIHISDETVNNIVDENLNKIKIYPTCTSGFVNIDLVPSINQILNLTVIDLGGKMVLEKKITGPQYILDLSSVQKGYYLLQVGSGKNLIKQMIQKL